jgi:hypothetical protein
MDREVTFMNSELLAKLRLGGFCSIHSIVRALQLFVTFRTSYRGDPVSNPGLVMWDFVMDKSGAGAG